jgi:hypothetical protein
VDALRTSSNLCLVFSFLKFLPFLASWLFGSDILVWFGSLLNPVLSLCVGVGLRLISFYLKTGDFMS